MHDQVGVAADGAGEVRVHARGQAEVAQVLLVVARQLHRPQQQVRDQLLLRPAGALAQDALEVLGPHALEAGRHAVAERSHQLAELLDLERVGLLVDAEQRAGAGFGQARGHGLVGRQHELFDQAHAVEALAGAHVGHAALGVEREHGLGQVEVECAAPEAALAHQLGQLVHAQQQRHQGREARAQFGVAVDDALGLLVAELGRALDHAVVELGLLHAAGGVEHQHDRLRQPLLALDQRAHVARQRVRQHGHDPVGEIDRRASQVGLLVDQAAGRDVVGHVGDVHAQEPAAVGQAVEADRVVVVARGLGVDRHRQPGPEVGATGALGLAHLDRHARGLGLDLLREGVGQAVLGHHHLDVHARVVERAQDLGHAAHRVARGRRRARDLGRHHLARLGRPGVAGRDEQLVQDAPVERHHVASEAPVFLIAADHALQPALEDADDAPLGALGRVTLDPDDHAVAVQRVLQVQRRDVHVGPPSLRRLTRPGLRHHEAKAGRVAGQPADDQARARGQRQARAADLDHFAALDQAAQQALQLTPLLAPEVEAAHQVAHGDGLAALAQQFEYFLFQRSPSVRPQRIRTMSLSDGRPADTRSTAAPPSARSRPAGFSRGSRLRGWCRRWDLNPHSPKRTRP